MDDEATTSTEDRNLLLGIASIQVKTSRDAACEGEDEDSDGDGNRDEGNEDEDSAIEIRRFD